MLLSPRHKLLIIYNYTNLLHPSRVSNKINMQTPKGDLRSTLYLFSPGFKP